MSSRIILYQNIIDTDYYFIEVVYKSYYYMVIFYLRVVHKTSSFMAKR